MIPTNKDLEKQKQKIAQLTKLLDEDGYWSKKRQLVALRSAIRQIWLTHPIKLLVVEKSKIPDDDPNTRRKWKAQCAKCRRWFKLTDIEVDHIDGTASLLDALHLYDYMASVLHVKESHLQCLCKKCHGVKTHMERKGNLSWQEAEIDKYVIGFGKLSAPEQRQLLEKAGIELPNMRNAKLRKEAYRQYLLELSLQGVGYE